MSTENGSDLVRPGSISKKLCDLSQYTKYQRIKVNELIERTHPHRACARSLASEKKKWRNAHETICSENEEEGMSEARQVES